eukprot:gene34063-biopygen8986
MEVATKPAILKLVKVQKDGEVVLEDSEKSTVQSIAPCHLQVTGSCKLVMDVRRENRHRTWGKALRMSVLGDKNGRFEATPKDIDKLGKLVVALFKTEFLSAGLDVSSFDFEAEMFFESTDSSTERDGRRALLDLIKGCVPPGVRQSHQEEHAALRYPAKVDPRPLLATEHQLVRENRALDWRPTEQTRNQQLFDRLDPEFYRAQQADLGGEAGTAPFAAALAAGDDVKSDPALKAILDKITVLEHFIRGGCKGPLTPAMKKAALGARSGLNGYRAGSAKDGRPPAKHTGTAAAFCCPLDGEGMQAMALAQVFQDAADCGPDAFAAAIEVHGAPAVLTAGGAAAELDMSAYGFTVPAEGRADYGTLATRLD